MEFEINKEIFGDNKKYLEEKINLLENEIAKYKEQYKIIEENNAKLRKENQDLQFSLN